MPLALARVLVAGLGLYLAAGGAFALAFVTSGVGRIDPSARDAGWGFRVLIAPGVAALWPVLLRRWISGSSEPPDERNSHRDAASAEAAMILRLRRRHRVAILVLAIALPVFLWAAVRARRPRPEMERLPAAAAAEGEGR